MPVILCVVQNENNNELNLRGCLKKLTTWKLCKSYEGK
jgi:hypothetical protein